MAVVTWNRGPWASRDRTMPYQSLTAPQGQMPSRGYQFAQGVPMPTSDMDPQGGAYSGVNTSPERDTGPMTSEERDVLGTIGDVSSIGKLGLGLLGVGVPGLGYLGTAISAARLADSIARALGAVREGNPYAGLLSPETIATMRDVQPNEAAAAQSARDAMEASMRETGMQDVGERFGVDVTASGNAGDVGGNPGEGQSPSGGAGEGGMAKGGVKRFRKPTKLRVGDNPMRDETIIGVPREMRKPGIQGKERQVRRGLQSAYRSLMPRGPAYPRGPIAPGGK